MFSKCSLRLLLIFLTAGFIVIGSATHASELPRRYLVTGSPIQGSNGIRVSPDGLLYVASAVTSRIDVFDSHSGQRLQSLGQEQGVFGADDLAFSPDGVLYWTAFFTGQVMRMAENGSAELVAQLGPGVNAISFSVDGRLFVSRVFLGDELYEIDPQGVQSPRLIQQNLGGLNAMDFGSDGYLYGPLWFKGQVARIDIDSGALEVVAEGFDTPAAIKFSPEGNLHVLDQHEGLLYRVDHHTGEKTIVASPGQGADNLAFNHRGHIFITNAHEGGVSRVLANGRLQEVVVSGLSMPAGITIDSQGQLVVAAAQSLRHYDARNGGELSITHASIGDVRTVATPLTVSPMGDDLLVSSWFSNTVQVWDPVTKTIKKSFSDFAVPLNAIAMGDDLVVAELATHRVVRRQAGVLTSEVLMEGIAVPTGLVYGDGQLYVADWLSGNIYQLMQNHQQLASPRIIASGLQQPEGLALDRQGRLLVMETGRQALIRIDLASLNIEELANELAIGLRAVPGYPPSWLMSSVVVDNCGRIIVTQDQESSLIVIGKGTSGVKGYCP